MISELANNKIKIIFCDEKHNPSSELIPYFGAHNTSKKILNQIEWKKERKEAVWQLIIKNKIHNQGKILEKLNIHGYEKLYEYENQVELGDKTNREGHAAKVYFNLLFGKDFIRGKGDNVNIALDYGYTILLSIFNREVVSKGYITPLGINHKNEFNQFNLSCDLMEPYRPLVDYIVYNNINNVLDKSYKYKLINVINESVNIEYKEQFVSNAIPIFINSVFRFLENERESKISNYEF